MWQTLIKKNYIIMKNIKQPVICASAIAACLFSLQTTHAATIAWDAAATNIAGDSDVSTNGTSEWAYSNGGITGAVNGVTFASATAAGNADVTYAALTSSNATAFRNLTDGSAFVGLSTGYQDILRSGNFVGGGSGSATVSLLGLTSGYTYEVQFWVNDARNRSDMETVPRETTIDGTSIVVDYNTTGANTDAGLGQYITGSFTADAATQNFSFTSGARQLNAIQLRLTAVPEPSSTALLGLGGLAMILRRRR